MDFEIKGKKALILSSTKGLGFGCAEALIKEGVYVVINGRNEEHGITAIEKLGPMAHFIKADITRPEDRLMLFDKAKKILGKISILIANSDGPKSGTFVNKQIKDWEDAFNLVVLSAIDIANKCIPEMINDGYGRIINISSTSAKETTPGSVLANAIKPALIGAFGSLAREICSTGVTVNSILPGPFDTERIRKYAQSTVDSHISEEEAIKRFAGNTPMKRIGTIQEIGALCAFLCSKQASYITGQSIVIDGGQVTSFL